MDKEEKTHRIFGILFVGFMVVTTILTVLSKSLYNYRLPVVTVLSPIQGSQGDAMIPVMALRQDVKGYYVLTLQEDDGVLGVGYRAVRMTVDFLSVDEKYCTVLGIPEGELVIVEATSEVIAGDHVNYEGGGAEK